MVYIVLLSCYFMYLCCYILLNFNYKPINVISLLAILEYENYDLKNIVTPVRVNEYRTLLQDAGYDRKKMRFLVNGFTNGFSLGYAGPTKVKRYSPNLKLRIGSAT